MKVNNHLSPITIAFLFNLVSFLFAVAVVNILNLSNCSKCWVIISSNCTSIATCFNYHKELEYTYIYIISNGEVSVHYIFLYFFVEICILILIFSNLTLLLFGNVIIVFWRDIEFKFLHCLSPLRDGISERHLNNFSCIF